MPNIPVLNVAGADSPNLTNARDRPLREGHPDQDAVRQAGRSAQPGLHDEHDGGDPLADP